MADLASGDRLPHAPVLYKEIIHALEPKRGGFYVDGTLGAGGHAFGILEQSAPDGRLMGFDVDPVALSLAKEKLALFGERAVLVQASYVTLAENLKKHTWPLVDGIVLDLGASSMQFDTPERGFSFLHDAPLDMRFDPTRPVTAADLVNELPEGELADLIYQYGEEQRSRSIARAIVRARPLQTTIQLAQVVAGAAGGRREYSTERKPIHPATRTFQALRIVVNGELDAIESVLPQAVAALRPGGRLAIIAFHSLEDRIVKEYFRRESKDCLCPPRQPLCTCGHRASLVEVARRPIRPTEEEVIENGRARSARLRVAQKLGLDREGGLA